MSIAVGLAGTYTYAQTLGTENTDTTKSSSSSMSQSGPDFRSSNSGTANSGARDHATSETDRGLNARIREAFNRDSKLREASSSVILNSNNGIVILNGTVATEKEKKDLETELQRVAGVSQVQNELLIAPRPSNPKANSTTQNR